MRQAVLEAPKRFVVQEVPKPEAVAGTLVVKVRFTSICGSDIHLWEWGPSPEDPKAKHAFDAVSQAFFGFPPTFILGHQISGEIADIGDRDTPFRQGQRVVIRGAGGYAEYALAMGLFGATLSEVVYPLPDEVSDEQGALVEPLSVAVDVVRRSGLRLGDVVVVQGAGTIGLFVLQALERSLSQRSRRCGSAGLHSSAPTRSSTPGRKTRWRGSGISRTASGRTSSLTAPAIPRPRARCSTCSHSAARARRSSSPRTGIPSKSI